MVAIIVTREYEVKAHELNRPIIPRIRKSYLKIDMRVYLCVCISYT